jgi:cyclic pyranopterin phosphate synthase
VDREDLTGPAAYWRIAGAIGMVGFITPVSSHFCGECNRIRVSSTGMARSCLFSKGGVDLKPLLEGGDDSMLQRALRGVIESKPERHSFCGDPKLRAPLPMSQVGG